MGEVFVYGTLRRGFGANERFLQESEFMGEARVEGFKMYTMGVGYPFLVKKQGGVVLGELYRVDERVLAALDEYEGCPQLYIRQTVQVNERSVFVYVFSESEGDALYIESGDWKEYTESLKDGNLSY